MKPVGETITNDKALALREPLEAPHRIKLDRTLSPAKNISRKLYTRITTQKAKQLHRKLEKMRNEWSRS
ncbi:MAG: hypothetical protein MUC38_07320 [Cyclobacteriaceae bacterium]|jgi:hypothetical protein|nr:hypothetical protein [Cyclobacteriaceae bacterium]